MSNINNSHDYNGVGAVFGLVHAGVINGETDYKRAKTDSESKDL